MKDLRKMWETRAIRVQHGGKLAVMFEQVHTFTRDPIHGRSGAKDALAGRETGRLNEPPDAPIEAVGRAFRTAVLHQLEQLAMADKLRVAHLAQQGDVAIGADDEAVFGVSHSQICFSSTAAAQAVQTRIQYVQNLLA